MLLRSQMIAQQQLFPAGSHCMTSGHEDRESYRASNAGWQAGLDGYTVLAWWQ